MMTMTTVRDGESTATRRPTDRGTFSALQARYHLGLPEKVAPGIVDARFGAPVSPYAERKHAVLHVTEPEPGLPVGTYHAIVGRPVQ